MENILNIDNRADFRQWLESNSTTAKECWVRIQRGRPRDDKHFWYIDAVEEALCYGWIDSTYKNINGERWNRFSPRQSRSPWTELNRERVRRLERLGLMTEAGRRVAPADSEYVVPSEIKQALIDSGAWDNFVAMPPLYQRVRAYNVQFYRSRDIGAYQKALQHLVDMTKRNQMYGEWNDYGRL